MKALRHYALAGLIGLLLFAAIPGCSLNDILGISEKGELQGVVYDGATGGTRRLAGVIIIVAGQETTSNTNGEYYLDDLSIGTHKLSASRAGYRTHTANVRIQEKASSDPTANRHSFTLQYDE